MAEAEEVVTNVARHATVFARDLWHRYRGQQEVAQPLPLTDVTQRLSLLICSIFGVWHDIRTAQPPAPRTLLQSVFGARRPVRRQAVPATDDAQLWLPASVGCADRDVALQRYRTMALQQAMRARRRSAAGLTDDVTGLARDLYLLLEAVSADEDLVRLLPGTASSINDLRRESLELRPPLSHFPGPLRPLEAFVRRLMQSECGSRMGVEPCSRSPEGSRREALKIAQVLQRAGAGRHVRTGASLLLKDYWTGELIPPGPGATRLELERPLDADDDDAQARSSRLPRRPQVRENRSEDQEDDRDPGIWMVQADEPHEKAEDPMGVQRPTDRDDHPDADQLGDMLGELPEARLVRSPERPKEILLADDPPPSTSRASDRFDADRESRFSYPEWDFRHAAYRHPGATVRVLPPQTGSRTWVESVLAEHRSMLEVIRRRFEMLRARRIVLKRQVDGEEIDLGACIDALADVRAGAGLREELYQRCRPAQRDIAIMLLVDASGSTDAWVASHRRIIDVEREALLLVCIALREMGESYAVRAFSGEGPEQVTVRPIMGFDDNFDDDVALRIAALEPERYTRAGAAIRHATSELMQKSARDRLLLLLSDGKPNDVDQYEGRYGIEDMRQAVAEARMQGIHPFCLTIDRQAAGYLPRIFGANQYAMLPKPELLPTVLLDWMRRLIATRQR